jgi:selenide,water dikinase
LRVRDTHELVDHPGVFAAGDCCHVDRHPRPKAGVFAVRAGPVLAENVARHLNHQQLRHHRPQKEFLGLISTGDKYAVASKGSWFCMEGAWLWNVKDWIDRKWMAKYSTDIPDF